MKTSVKMTDFAEPFVLDLQLFAEGEGGGEATTETAVDPLESLYSMKPIDGFADESAGESATDEAKPDNADQVEDAKPDDIPPANDEKGNAKWAEMRRRAEETDKLKAEIARRDEEMTKRFGEQGIKTFDDLVAGWDKAIDQQKQQQSQQVKQEAATFDQQLNKLVQDMRAQGYDEIQIGARVDSAVANFKIRQIELREQQREERAKMEQQQRAAEQAQRDKEQTQQANIERGSKLLYEDFEALKKEYGDLLPDATGETAAAKAQSVISQLDPETLARLQRGYTLKDAFVASHHADILAGAEKKGKQQTLNAVNGRSHLKPSSGTSEVETATIPEETLKFYKQLNPGKTQKEYLEHYKRSMKG